MYSAAYAIVLVFRRICTERMLGLGDGSELLTNADLVELLHPSNPKLPYVYEGFNKWGTCTDWDPCPECGDASSGG